MQSTPFRTTYNINAQENIDFIQKMRADLILSVRPGHIFKQHLIRSVPRIINLHCSMLPYYRGIGGVLQALAAGEEYLGCSIHEIKSEQLDRGAIVKQSSIKRIPKESVYRHTIKLYNEAKNLIPAALIDICYHNENLKSNENGSYFSWFDNSVRKKLHGQQHRLLKSSDLFYILFSGH